MTDLGFRYSARKSGEVVISHRGRQATVLRGADAAAFLAEAATMDEDARQQEMARLTGNYRRGNERDARNHPRNR
ncbi:hypothetical protein ATO6_10585 [Oceanicola sp. 22II-s10i]|uniref:hypothetical protein n=1 Tax=Oceanicola sp. 22II-s10i TaxID=1317116 RepID=UPI000B522B58|nr:hypothetical protein [Oceanicola sp. 22II-s10i]OWU84766.1 hypothetical protein ATO6_10585 [Oceanicola sp. 22II-s10i]